MKIVYRDYNEKSRQIAGKRPLGIPHDIVVPCGDLTVIIRLDDGTDIEITEDKEGYMKLRALNVRIGLAPSIRENILRIMPFPYTE